MSKSTKPKSFLNAARRPRLDFTQTHRRDTEPSTGRGGKLQAFAVAPPLATFISADENFWFFFVPLVLWIGVIFYFSSGKGSIAQTARYLVPLLARLFPGRGARELARGHVVVRKLCHFFGYAILGGLAAAAFFHSPVQAAARLWPIIAFTVVAAIAAADEFRQSFDPRRVGSLADVALDCTGGLASILLLWFLI